MPTLGGLLPVMNILPALSLLKKTPLGSTTRGQSVVGPSGHLNTNTSLFRGLTGSSVCMMGLLCSLSPTPAIAATLEAQGPDALTRWLQWIVRCSPVGRLAYIKTRESDILFDGKGER